MGWLSWRKGVAGILSTLELVDLLKGVGFIKNLLSTNLNLEEIARGRSSLGFEWRVLRTMDLLASLVFNTIWGSRDECFESLPFTNTKSPAEIAEVLGNFPLGALEMARHGWLF